MQTLPRILGPFVPPALGVAFTALWLIAEAGRMTPVAAPGAPSVAWLPFVLVGLAIAVSRLSPVLALAITAVLLVGQLFFWWLRFGYTGWPAYFGLLIVVLVLARYADRRLTRAAIAVTAVGAIAVAALVTLPAFSPDQVYGILNGWTWNRLALWGSFILWAGVILFLALAAWVAGVVLQGGKAGQELIRRLGPFAYPGAGMAYTVVWLQPALSRGRPVIEWLPLLLVGVVIGISQRFPRIALAVVGALLLIQFALLGSGGSYGPDYFTAYAGLIVAGVTIVAAADRSTRRAALPLYLLYSLGIAALLQQAIIGPETVFLLGIWTIPLALVALATWLTGFGIRALLDRNRAEQLRLRAEADLAESEAELLVASERDRIAQDVHDIMAHSLSVIVAQADGARFLDGKRPSATAESLEAIAKSARESLLEVRMLIDSLSSEPEGHSHPTLESLPALLDRLGNAGLGVTEQTIGEPKGLTAGQELSVYRIVQEALTNALKHAGPRPAANLTLDWRGPGLALSITSRGPQPPEPRPSPGQQRGLTGMRERARLAGGWLSAGRDDDEPETFIVTAFIPDASLLQTTQPAPVAGAGRLA